MVTFRSAKNNGLLYTFADSAAKRAVRVSLYLQLILCAVLLIFWCGKTGVLVLITAAGSFLYYRYRSYHELGGITGDTAGYFVMICGCGCGSSWREMLGWNFMWAVTRRERQIM